MRHKLPERSCTQCGKRYFRRNLVEAWDKTNPGHRDGWNKSKLKICTDCMSATKATSMLTMVQVRIVGRRRSR